MGVFAVEIPLQEFERAAQRFFAENVETPKMQVPAEIQDNLVDAIYD